jgi:tRNA-specific 2-thiouridylase
MTRLRVAVAMSGGLDSSVAALLLQQQGHSVRGVTLRLWDETPADPVGAAAAACAHLGIAHEVLDLRAEFRRRVVDYFVASYARGLTPNPCLRCNRDVKFGLLLEHVLGAGDDRLATGHYVRIEDRADGGHLLCGLDPAKDQSYFLYMLTQAHLARLSFPLGAWRKADVRALAARHGLPAAERAESQDVCFLPEGDYRRLVAAAVPEAVRPGPIYDLAGRELGRHRGLPYYTVGQRGGLGIAAPRPLYVARLDVTRNALVVGYREELARSSLAATEMTYVAGRPPAAGVDVTVKIRYRARPVAARFWPEGESGARLELAVPLYDITPGQAAVLYAGDEVLGGGIIARPAGEPAAGEAQD